MILVPNNKVDNCKKKISWFKAIEPIEIVSPVGFHILPEIILQDESITKKVPQLLDFNLIEESEIVFKVSEII